MAELDKLVAYWERDKTNPDLSASVLTEYLRSSDFEEGLSWSSALPVETQNVPQVISLTGMMALGAQDFENAKQKFLMLRDARPDDVNIAYNLASAHHGLGEYEKALAATKPVESDWPSCEAIYLLNARCHHHLQQLDAAVESVDEFLKRHPGHNQASGLLSLVLLDKGDYERATAVSESVLSQSPDQFEATLAVVGGLIAQQKLDDAEKWVAKAADAFPEVGRIRESQGQLALMRMDYDGARESFEESARLMPQHIGSWHLLGWTQVLQEDLVAAAQSFEKALLIDRNFAESHGGAAVVDALRDQVDSAQKSIRRARGLDPNNLSARFAESILLNKDGKTDEADAIIGDLFATKTGTAVQGLMPILLQRIEAEREQARDN